MSYVFTKQHVLVEGVPEVDVTQVKFNSDKVLLIDVRSSEEFTGELGHIEGAKLFSLGAELDSFLEKEDKSKEIVFLCRSGRRSASATLQARDLGFNHCYNMTGGMLEWNDKEYPVS